MRVFLVLISVLFVFSTCKKEKEEARTVLNTNPFAEEPPQNPFLANSPWPITHYNSYAQASSPYPGPMNAGENSTKDYVSGAPGMITVVISNEYPNGERVLWGGNAKEIVKMKDNGSGYTVISKIAKEDVTLAGLFSVDEATSGAYTFIDKDNVFFSPRKTKIYAYSDEVPNDPNSGIQLLRTFEIPSNLIGENERIVGMNLTYDGNIAFATNNGLVGVVSRNFGNLYTFQFPNEEISNSIAVDEDNGIYVVTSAKMYRVQWTGTALSIDENKGGWSADYETGSGASGIRLGAGSGSTPTLMGFGAQDKMVVLTDGQDLMHLVLMWRDKIPENWTQIPGTKSRRIAAQIPIYFGNLMAQKSLSEQSVCVRGYGMFVVNNELKNATGNRTANIIISGNANNAPYGAEKFEWNPQSRKVNSVWVNKTVSLPSGIPCMSAATNLIYCIGQNNSVWNFTALDWNTGSLVFRYPLGSILEFNSAYAATEIGLNNSLYSGTLFGVTGMWEGE